MYWDEDNRLMVLSDNGKTSRYTYNAAGERIMKSYGTMEGVYINGAPQGITFHGTDNFTLYPASIISINKNRFTKHYFIGDKRIASRIGTGLFNNVYGRNGSYVTAGQQDYAERMNQIQKQKEAYYKQQGIAPGVPTMKGAYGDPENTHIGYNSIIRELGNHDVPQGWVQTPRPNTTPDTNPGPPVSWNDPSNPDDPQAGYGYIPNDTTKEETFFYHSDHLGSTSYITDDKANITQYDAYLPYGELLVDEHSSSEDLPYKFNGKQFDEETGLYYYGARYMNPVASIWYGVDPLAEKFVDCSGYEYCMGNPIKLIDENGLYPTSVLKLHKTGWWIFSRSYYTFTPPAAHLLSLVSGINEKHIKGMSIYERSLSHPWPYYDFFDKTDFGGVTLPHGNSFETTYTSNLFDDEKFGQSVMDWLAIASHEVGHIKHIIQSNKLADQIYLTLLKARENSNGRAIVPSKDEYRLQYYVGMFADSYIKAGSHDGSTLEHEAERGRAIFYDFSKFLSKNKKYGSGFLRNLFHSKRSDSYKIGIIDKIWKEYVEYRKANDKK
ncbi:RHS repeat-associated core domain protein [Prevotella multiformis DSM 16608]|uniref:RHS repeat-associated core domain protein n=2 Tax=Prevotella multiformis TaxID=282402 RepID=F0FAB3_9BACT|nr:RHS repeat-associated core domain protein [Prevotella multiformis DSM 16608]